MIETIILFVLALLPIVILGYYTYSRDREKEPKKMLFKLFLGGLGSAILTIILSFVLRTIFPFFDGDPQNYGPIKLLVYTFIVIAFIEEFSKFIMTFLLSYHNKEYDELYDMIVYSVFVSLGFAWIENVLYVFQGGIAIAINRLLFSVPTHASVAVFMGYYLSFSKLADINHKEKLRKKYLIYSILIPIMLHGFYDYLVYSNSYILVYVFFIFTCLLFVKANKKLCEMSHTRTVLVTKYCPNCGSSVKNCNFCSECGQRII